MKAFIFPGQGSQYVGMAKEFAADAVVSRFMEEADDILHVNLSRTMLGGPDDVLKSTDYTQPAIFLHSMIALKFTEGLETPSAYAGHSLGEFSALTAAGVFEYADALKLVHLRGKLMAEAGRRNSGTMAAIIGLESDVLTALSASVETETGKIVRPANFNSPGQIVISGSVDGVHEVMKRAKEQGVRIAKELPVSGAFHSPLMQYAADGLKEALDSVELNEPSTPVFANVTAQPHGSADEIRNLLVEQLTSPVRWEESVRAMAEIGITEFTEFGPGKVLQGLVSRTLQSATVSGVEKPAAN
ncbi:MAG: ACP S-malonyltransferase [bacterium]